ncbi:MAG: AbrB/MazE/SpoVT family DNA-binding domain-containing protein [Deltaproteobacteria bacterium]|jgi:AbrB family looped-hinge helix DNA binding protein|nr:AbrB/MazE/SpoVT family DNA-binding domain-containing protein [Deltaproteobacteria bacterium]
MQTKLSSKGQIIIPKVLRSRYNWNAGQKLSVIDTGDGILLKPSRTFENTELEQVAGILKYSGEPISIDGMEEAIKKGALEHKQ